MTHTTTDAAEARALKACPFCGGDAEFQVDHGRNCIDVGCTRCTANQPPSWDFASKRWAAEAWNNRATAEAASGAGERHPDDMAVDLFTAQMKAKLAASRAKGRGGWDDPARCSTEYLRHLLHEHVAKGDPIDVANFCMMLAHYGASTAALPPAMVDTGELVEMLSAATLEEGATVFEHSAEEIGLEVMEHHKAVLAALAAAPTIPATGEAIPEGMKPWHGGDEEPGDWEYGLPAYLRNGEEYWPNSTFDCRWKRGRGADTEAYDIIAYTPKATIPATGHAATEGEGA